MSSWRNPSSIPVQSHQQQQQENGPRAKCDQVVFEAIAKAAEIVVGSRCWIDPPFSLASGGNNSSSRFNLLVPEVQGVRSILQRWKRALHVPLRLDVYYQHADSRRELLERWCLEYAPKSATSTTGNGGTSNGGFATLTTDPIVQLRQVCKQIVIWLRTLFCWSRMLPAQALRVRNNSQIGFSIYVVSEGNDDVSGLVSNQGFLSQGQPHSVFTPYGELGWRVFYAPKPIVQRLVPEKPAYPTSQTSQTPNTYKATSQPIPMRQQQQQQQQQQSFGQNHQNRQDIARTHQDQNRRQMLLRRDSSPPVATAQSAPSQRKIYQRSHSDVNRAGNAQLAKFDLIEPTRKSDAPNINNDLNNTTNKGLSTNPPTKTLSGLSLALMQSDDDISDKPEEEPLPVDATPSTTDPAAAEKRRAALHHVPPQFSPHTPSPILSPIMKKSLASAGEYGYGYNNHLPSLNRNPSTSSNHSRNDDNQNNTRDLTASPSSLAHTPLASTPPGTGFLYGGPTPPSVVPSNLIPPRSSVTPPFVRPMGFVGEPPSQPLPPAAMSASSAQHAANSQQQQKNQHTTSLDLLHSSPFQQPHHHQIGSIFSNSSAGLIPPAEMMSGHHHPFAMHDFPSGLDARYDEYDRDDHEDMPFAVDTSSSLGGTGFGENGAMTPFSLGAASTATAGTADASAAIASIMSTKKHQRLALFDSQQVSTSGGGNNEDDMMNSLADQLAEFKSFGASLMTTTSNGDGASEGAGGVDSSGATSAPIPLRT